MKITNHEIPDVKIIDFAPRADVRGYFMRVWDRDTFLESGLAYEWVQENQSLSVEPHTLRGLHYQAPPYAETKFVRCLSGAILDVFVDLRAGSPTHGRWGAVPLRAEDNRAILVPKGFAHGYLTLFKDTVVTYKVDAPYTPSAEGGLMWNDPALGINWSGSSPILSDKDQKWPLCAALPALKVGF